MRKQIGMAAMMMVCVAAAGAAGMEAGDRAEMAAVLKAPVTPTKAVHIAEQGGGRAYAFGMEVARGKQWYEVDVLRGDAKLELRVDPVSGKVLGSAAARGEDAQGAHALDGSALTLAEAVAQAEHSGNGPALEAGAGGHGADAHVSADIIHGGRLLHYRVSMRDGQIVAVQTGAEG